MKKTFFVVLSLFIASVSLAENTVSGLKDILTEAEWKRAGLDRLSPDQIGVIDAALIRHHGAVVKQVVATTVASTTASHATTEKKPGLLQRFGLPSFYEAEWRDLPPLQATVKEWVTANRFKLDNGQVWEGFEAIPYDLVGKQIEIRARPRGQFALTLDGKSTAILVMRLR